MISGSLATTNTNTTRSSLSYINTVISGATQEGLYSTVVRGNYMDDSMANVLRQTYGYNVTKKDDIMGSLSYYTIKWG
jgi:hypothetical protein